jgi:hypothetical protein
LIQGVRPTDPAQRCSSHLRQTIESLNPTFTGQVDLEHHGGRTPEMIRILRRILALTLHSFTRLEEKVGAPDADLAGIAADIVERVEQAWPSVAESVAEVGTLVDAVTSSIENRRKSLLRGTS